MRERQRRAELLVFDLLDKAAEFVVGLLFWSLVDSNLTGDNSHAAHKPLS